MVRLVCGTLDVSREKSPNEKHCPIDRIDFFANKSIRTNPELDNNNNKIRFTHKNVWQVLRAIAELRWTVLENFRREKKIACVVVRMRCNAENPNGKMAKLLIEFSRRLLKLEIVGWCARVCARCWKLNSLEWKLATVRWIFFGKKSVCGVILLSA